MFSSSRYEPVENTLEGIKYQDNDFSCVLETDIRALNIVCNNVIGFNELLSYPNLISFKELLFLAQTNWNVFNKVLEKHNTVLDLVNKASFRKLIELTMVSQVAFFEIINRVENFKNLMDCHYSISFDLILDLVKINLGAFYQVLDKPDKVLKFFNIFPHLTFNHLICLAQDKLEFFYLALQKPSYLTNIFNNPLGNLFNYDGLSFISLIHSPVIRSVDKINNMLNSGLLLSDIIYVANTNLDMFHKVLCDQNHPWVIDKIKKQKSYTFDSLKAFLNNKKCVFHFPDEITNLISNYLTNADGVNLSLVDFGSGQHTFQNYLFYQTMQADFDRFQLIKNHRDLLAPAFNVIVRKESFTYLSGNLSILKSKKEEAYTNIDLKKIHAYYNKNAYQAYIFPEVNKTRYCRGIY